MFSASIDIDSDRHESPRAAVNSKRHDLKAGINVRDEKCESTPPAIGNSEFRHDLKASKRDRDAVAAAGDPV